MIFQGLVSWYKRYERPISSLSLFGGFLFDALTLRRVDTFWENFWVLIHLVLAAILILLINRNSRKESMGEQGELDFWLVNFLQFVYGGLLSAFLVFYFRSAALSVSWPFLLMLGLAFIANERVKRHRTRLAFQASLLYLSILSFAIFFVPVLVGSIGPWVFVLSGLASLVIMWLFISLLRKIMGEKYAQSRRALRIIVLTIFVAVNALYFTNILPPIPLSLKEGGVYYSVSRDASDNYVLLRPAQSFLEYLNLYPKIPVKASGQMLYAYTAIFSPARFSTSISHVWQRYDEERKVWVTTSTVLLSISGGRGGGYRTYSSSAVIPGKWRVQVRTPGGQLIGRIGFTAVAEGQ